MSKAQGCSPLPYSEFERVLQIILERDISANTNKAIQADLKHFCKWFSDENKVEFRFSNLTVRDLVDYKNFCVGVKGYAPQTTNRRLNSLKMLLSTGFQVGLLKKPLEKEIKLLPLQPLAPKGLTKGNLRALIREVELRDSLRDILIVEMLAGAGLRVSELVGLEVSDVVVNDRSGFVNIRHSKGGKTRKVPLNVRIRQLLSKYLDGRSSGRLFLGQRGPLTTIAVNKVLEKYSNRIRLKCSPHTLRHTFAYNYLKNNSNDIVGLSQILGHSNLNTTAIYTQNRLEDLQEKVDRM